MSAYTITTIATSILIHVSLALFVLFLLSSIRKENKRWDELNSFVSIEVKALAKHLLSLKEFVEDHEDILLEGEDGQDENTT